MYSLYFFLSILYILLHSLSRSLLFFFFFFNDTATTEIYTLSLHDALPIYAFVEHLELILCGVLDAAGYLTFEQLFYADLLTMSLHLQQLLFDELIERFAFGYIVLIAGLKQLRRVLLFELRAGQFMPADLSHHCRAILVGTSLSCGRAERHGEGQPNQYARNRHWSPPVRTCCSSRSCATRSPAAPGAVTRRLTGSEFST